MRVDIDCGKYTYVFEDGRAHLLRYGEPTSRDVVGDKLIYCMAAEIETMRQQLAERDEQISDLTISSDTYFAERNSARDVWRRASKDRDDLRQQLAETLIVCNAKDNALSRAKNRIQGLSEMLLPSMDECKYIDEALSQQPPKEQPK